MKNDLGEFGRRQAWDSYFSGAMSISLHPGAGKNMGSGMSTIRSVEECAVIADDMLIERDKRFPLES